MYRVEVLWFLKGIMEKTIEAHLLNQGFRAVGEGGG